MTARQTTIWMALAPLLIVLVAGLPLFLAFAAGALADAYGCRLHEGFSNPCIIAGTDWGETLYAMFVMGWFALLTLPVGVIAFGVWAVLALVFLSRYVARRRAARSSGK